MSSEDDHDHHDGDEGELNAEPLEPVPVEDIFGIVDAILEQDDKVYQHSLNSKSNS